MLLIAGIDFTSQSLQGAVDEDERGEGTQGLCKMIRCGRPLIITDESRG